MMNKVLGDLIFKCCFVFIDDVIVYGATEAEVIENTKLVLDRVFGDNLKLGGKKCEFLIEDCDILGHRVADGKLMPQVDKL